MLQKNAISKIPPDTSKVLFECIPGTQGFWRVVSSNRLKTTEHCPSAIYSSGAHSARDIGNPIFRWLVNTPPRPSSFVTPPVSGLQFGLIICTRGSPGKCLDFTKNTSQLKQLCGCRQGNYARTSECLLDRQTP